ncbi:MAG TPA: hypothetical protein VD970_03970 [Acetobacteraceae bacterium]|nr:hypothetical protein [Acetobacteraceae bacterium]
MAPALLALALTGAPAEAQNARQIIFHNDCPRPVRILIHHADGYRNWHPHAWWNFAPNERSYLLWDGRRLTQLDDHDLYFYAEATDGSRQVWDGNDTRVEWRGAQYNLRRARTGIDGGDLVVRLTC